jgi:addiction module HigA family antidote
MPTALYVAIILGNFRFPPVNHVKELKFSQAGQHYVRICGQWRIWFIWASNSRADVQIVKYHQEHTLGGFFDESVDHGKIRKELYFNPLELGATALARHLGVLRTQVGRLIKGSKGIKLDTVPQLVHAFNATPTDWVHLQTSYDKELSANKTDVSSTKSRTVLNASSPDLSRLPALLALSHPLFCVPR